MVCKPTSIKRRLWSSRAGFTLMEMLFAFLITGLVAFALVSIAIFSSRSFAAYANYVELNAANQLAMDTITRDLRECFRVTAASTNSLTLEDTDGTLIHYAHNATAKTVTRMKGAGEAKVLLSGCESLRFRLLQRNPINGTYDVYPTATPATAKVVDVAWNCSREILGVKANTENVQTARIVIRRQGT
jgi:type II secretory pathway component PulJ